MLSTAGFQPAFLRKPWKAGARAFRPACAPEGARSNLQIAELKHTYPRNFPRNTLKARRPAQINPTDLARPYTACET